MNNFSQKTLACLVLAISSLLLTACGGSPDDTEEPPQLPDYSQLSKTNVVTTNLKPATESSLEQHLKNGLRIKIRDNSNLAREVDFALEGAPVALVASAEFSTDSSTSDAGNSSNFSDTNTHVEGVDESDFIKYDGDHLFISSHPWWDWNNEKPSASVRILATDPDQATAEEVGTIALDDPNWGAVRELYLVEDSTDSSTEGLATIRSTWSYFCWIEPAFAEIDAVAADFAPTQNRDSVQVAVYDVSEPSSPDLDWTFSVDGYLQESRKIGNTLYLVTHFSPWIYGIDYYPQTDDETLSNEDLFEDTDLDDLLPSFTINDSEPQPIVSADDCYIPTETNSRNGLASLTTLVAIDLENKEIISSTCLNANVHGIYASQDNLYIGGASAGSWWSVVDSETIVHKFSLENGDINYRSTGKVPGFIGWNDPSFRMSEYNDYFRIVTSSRSSTGEPEHRLTILQDSESSDEMLEVASIPNETRPEQIGKPGEDIYSVRFYDDRAYIVTFERIDPLYVIDLNDPEDPLIAGELEVPGFSTYLHPINDNYLLGLGREVGDNRAGGLKVSLYDVSDSSNPLEVSNEIIGGRGSFSEALYDLHAASFLFTSDDNLRFTLPATVYSEADNYEWSHSALQLFEVNALTSSATLEHAGEIVAEESGEELLWPTIYSDSRSVLHDEAVYYIYGDAVYSAYWSSPQASHGPQ